MLVDYKRILSPEERTRFNLILEALTQIEPSVAQLLTNHRTTRPNWYVHEVVPWGRGQDFNETPWREEQNSLSPDVVVALETNLLTEDNLPYYHSHIERMIGSQGAWREWNRLWTSEEGAHAEVIRNYLYIMRVMDPKRIHDGRQQIMEQGFDRDFADPLELFAYTSAQELATRISHLRTGQRAEEPVILAILTNISRDENFHFIFYRAVVKELLEIIPELMLPAIANQLYTFEMPGSGMSNFELRQAMISNAGIYGAREHRDLVIMPLLRFWGIERMEGLSGELVRTQERILKLEKLLTRLVERQDRKQKKSD